MQIRTNFIRDGELERSRDYLRKNAYDGSDNRLPISIGETKKTLHETRKNGGGHYNT